MATGGGLPRLPALREQPRPALPAGGQCPYPNHPIPVPTLDPMCMHAQGHTGYPGPHLGLAGRAGGVHERGQVGRPQLHGRDAAAPARHHLRKRQHGAVEAEAALVAHVAPQHRRKAQRLRAAAPSAAPSPLATGQRQPAAAATQPGTGQQQDRPHCALSNDTRTDAASRPDNSRDPEPRAGCRTAGAAPS